MDEPIVEGRAGSAGGRGSAGASAREQRYNELLRSAPPPAASSVEAPAPSLLDRVVNPIADALGIARAKPQPAAPPRPAPQPQRPQNQQSSQQTNSNHQPEAPPKDEKPRVDDDPDTDLVPPQLQSAEFFPPEVHDGEETTLMVNVTDNLSGVRSVSGVIVSPSGGLTGFSCRPDGGRFVARVAIPKAAPEGTWVVRYMTLTDNASNNANVNDSQGGLPATARFRVSSAQGDSKAPTLTSATLDQMAMRAGDQNQMHVIAEDDKSGVAQVSGTFVSPSKAARLGFACKRNGEIWDCPLSPPTCLDCGTWILEQLQIQDAANNTAVIRNDNPILARLKLELTGESCDADPPTIQSIVLDPLVISNIEGGVIKVEAILADQGCGVASLNGQTAPVENPGGQRAYFNFEPSKDGRTFSGTITIPKAAAKGIWSISWIQAIDKGHNLKAYPANDPVISRVTFRVE
jgi:hypothetical protein